MGKRGDMQEAPRIINTLDQLKAFSGDRVAILFSPTDHGRGGRAASFHVIRIVDGHEIKTDPEAHYSDYGRRWFSAYPREKKSKALAAAIAWANERFGKREFVRNRMGDYVEKEVNEKFPIPVRKREKESVSL